MPVTVPTTLAEICLYVSGVTLRIDGFLSLLGQRTYFSTVY
jgi:hypothetical protein